MHISDIFSQNLKTLALENKKHLHIFVQKAIGNRLEGKNTSPHLTPTSDLVEASPD